MKYAENDLVKLRRDHRSLGVIVTTSPGHPQNAGVVSGNHYQVYWSAGQETAFTLEECWHTEEELTLAERK